LLWQNHGEEYIYYIYIYIYISDISRTLFLKMRKIARDSKMYATITVFEGVEDGVMRFKSTSTGAKAKAHIRDKYLLEGGGLEDDEGVTVEDDEELGERKLRFAGGVRSTGDKLSLFI
jgi:hypothetical protein